MTEVSNKHNYVECNLLLLTADQREVYDCCCSMIDSDEGSILFLDAPGGTGKTFFNRPNFSKASIRR